MKKKYTKLEMEVFIFSKQDQIKASSVVDTAKTIVEDPFADANGIAKGFFWY